MVKTVYLPLALTVQNPSMLDSDRAKWRQEKQQKWDDAVNSAQDELNQLLAKGYEVLASHLLDTNASTHIVFVLYLAPDKVPVPF